MKAPNTKFQAPEKFQIPKPKQHEFMCAPDPGGGRAIASGGGIWSLGFFWSLELGVWVFGLSLLGAASTATGADVRTYTNTLTRLTNPTPLLADHAEFVQPVEELNRYESSALVDDEGADLHVRAWRWSYNARGIIEMPNHLRATDTAIIMVHPWGVDDGQGWNTPEPAGVADFCTPGKNHLAAKHTRSVIDPFLKSLRGKVAVVLYSLPGSCDPIRRKLYRSFTHNPDADERKQGSRELDTKLRGFKYRGE